jgi:hypothetical protein
MHSTMYGEGRDMMDGYDSQPRFELNSRLLMSATVLIAIGGVLGLIGMMLGSTALIAASRRWVRQMDVPPSEIARQKWEKAKVATAAGVSAWREASPSEPARSEHEHQSQPR